MRASVNTILMEFYQYLKRVSEEICTYISVIKVAARLAPQLLILLYLLALL